MNSNKFRIKKIMLILYFFISGLSFFISAKAIICNNTYQKFKQQETQEVKHGEVSLKLEALFDSDWHSSQFAKNYNNDLTIASNNSDIYWFCIKNQAEYDELAKFCNLPNYTLPNVNNYYIISMGKEIDAFYISRLYRYKNLSTKYNLISNFNNINYNLENPIYRGIAKYNSTLQDATVYVYSIDKIDIIDPRSIGLQNLY